MQTRIYEIKDHDVIMRWFGEDGDPVRIQNLGEVHGTLLHEGNVSIHPAEGDVVLLEDAEEVSHEYIILCRVYDIDIDVATIYVHEIHFDETALS